MDLAAPHDTQAEVGMITPPASPVRGQGDGLEKTQYSSYAVRANEAFSDLRIHHDLGVQAPFADIDLHATQTHHSEQLPLNDALPEQAVLLLTPPVSPKEPANVSVTAKCDLTREVLLPETCSTLETDCIHTKQTESIHTCDTARSSGVEYALNTVERRTKGAEAVEKRSHFAGDDAKPLQKGSAALGKELHTCVPLDLLNDPFSGYSWSTLYPLFCRRRAPLTTLSSALPSGGSRSARNFRTCSDILDRFIPTRGSNSGSRDSFHVARAVDKLTHHEKVMRQGIYGPDPFSPRIRRAVRITEHQQSLRVARGSNGARFGPHESSGWLSLRGNSIRQVSNGAVWNVGGTGVVMNSVSGVSDGQGGTLARGTNSPLFGSSFLSGVDSEINLDAHERRLALAIDIDPTSRQIGPLTPPGSPTKVVRSCHFSCASAMGNRSTVSPLRSPITWRDNEWNREGSMLLLDAPLLRDDYYCSLLAYSGCANCLAVGLGNQVYLWSESNAVETADMLNVHSSAHITSLSFSPDHGTRAILAVGRADGHITLWSPLEKEPRFDSKQPNPISCVSFKPTLTKRPSLRDIATIVDTEELLIGDEAGIVSLYSVEWPSQDVCELFDWRGEITLLARLHNHTQQICGLAWSPSGTQFATGGNDNTCFLYEERTVLSNINETLASSLTETRTNGSHDISRTAISGQIPRLAITTSREKHKWTVHAAVKAIAFCPWQAGLIALGGGSNDRCIHFYHTLSGACLATIDCAAQITSLIWSKTRREIAATFGFAQPEHPYRIAVYSWPQCEQIVAIPWYDEHRALYAIPYPGGPNTGRSTGEGGVWWSRTKEEGCIVVASSDASIKFHEVWSEGKKATLSKEGSLGWSDILESLHGIEKSGPDAIR